MPRKSSPFPPAREDPREVVTKKCHKLTLNSESPLDLSTPHPERGASQRTAFAPFPPSSFRRHFLQNHEMAKRRNPLTLKGVRKESS